MKLLFMHIYPVSSSSSSSVWFKNTYAVHFTAMKPLTLCFAQVVRTMRILAKMKAFVQSAITIERRNVLFLKWGTQTSYALTFKMELSARVPKNYTTVTARHACFRFGVSESP